MSVWSWEWKGWVWKMIGKGRSDITKGPRCRGRVERGEGREMEMERNG